jgi:hypothetical protein
VQVALLLHVRFVLFDVGMVRFLEMHRHRSEVLESFDLSRSRM